MQFSDIYGRFGKRAIDLLIVALTSPIWLSLCLLISSTLWMTGHSVFFLSERQGQKGRVFVLYKFCTMRPFDPALHDSVHDVRRTTKVGKLLRILSLDELPQCFNVIKGQMSLIGPRPLPEKYFQYYSKEQRRRLSVLPGISGLAQVKGRNNLSWSEKFEYDIKYVDSLNLILDLRIILLTVKSIFDFSKVNADGHLTMEEFKGSTP